MLSHLGMQFEGRPHCGLDDARNIANVLIRMMTDGATVQANERIRWRNNDLAEVAKLIDLPHATTYQSYIERRESSLQF